MCWCALSASAVRSASLRPTERATGCSRSPSSMSHKHSEVFYIAEMSLHRVQWRHLAFSSSSCQNPQGSKLPDMLVHYWNAKFDGSQFRAVRPKPQITEGFVVHGSIVELNKFSVRSLLSCKHHQQLVRVKVKQWHGKCCVKDTLEPRTSLGTCPEMCFVHYSCV